MFLSLSFFSPMSTPSAFSSAISRSLAFFLFSTRGLFSCVNQEAPRRWTTLQQEPDSYGIMKVFDYSWHEKQCIKVLSSLSSCCFKIRSFPASITDTIKVRNIQESKRENALNDLNNHKPNAFKLIKLLLRDSQFPRFRNRHYQSQEYSGKQTIKCIKWHE